MSYDIYNEDCIAGMKSLADNSVDCIISDLPFHMTDCSWDKGVLDLAAMWTEFKRILKPYNSVILFASGKFTYKLIASNYDWYKYKWIWVKNAPTMFVHAKNAPMHKYEEILIFSDGAINHASCTTRRMKYNPQGVTPTGILKDNSCLSNTQVRGGAKYFHSTDKPSDVSLQGGKLKGNWRDGYNWQRGKRTRAFDSVFGKRPSHVDWYIQEQTGYPMDVIEFDVVPNQRRDHPTQKPTALLEYLIKTYTNEGELVLDATMGSGSTGVACMNTNRRFVGFELEEKFFNISKKRLDEAIAKRQETLFNLA